MSRALQQAWPEIPHRLVNVRKENSQYGTQCDPGCATSFDVPEAFEEEALDPPPFPASAYYEAKLWQVVKEKAAPNALMWNM